MLNIMNFLSAPKTQAVMVARPTMAATPVRQPRTEQERKNAEHWAFLFAD